MPLPLRRLDYQPPTHLVERVELTVDIREQTRVHSRLWLRPAATGAPASRLWLDGDAELEAIHRDGQPLPAAAWSRREGGIEILGCDQPLRLELVTRLDPERNTRLEGWYRSGPMLCTQCEAHGFSRITYFPDRPDVLSRYRVRLEADAARYPVLLANGNRLEAGVLPEGRHYAVWEDPHPKPCYLFAMVAGDLACVEDRYRTASGREVVLACYVDAGNEARTAHALDALKRAMRWDEQVYGLEYDLDRYMIVAARDFNMGAMENKGLNLFNARYVLASPETATDDDYHAVESVIAHEYFHNWTGNRVTCRDWFQLSLKEGLTVFRDQAFSADHHSAAVERIRQVRVLRAQQFVEDAGPMAHPVRPDEVQEINNFYTATVYEKGAELLRMIETRIGRTAFIAGVRHYLQRHDGQAVTIDDFLAALREHSGDALVGMEHWYSQSGTPQVRVEAEDYDPHSGHYQLTLSQALAPTARQPAPQPLPIPLRFGLRDEEGRPLPVQSAQLGSPALPREDLLLLSEPRQSWRFEGLARPPVLSLLLGFSAPVQLQQALELRHLAVLLQQESDGYARWEAGQQLLQRALRSELASPAEGREPPPEQALWLRAVQRLAHQPPEDRALLAELLRLPSERELLAQLGPVDPLQLAQARDRLALALAGRLTGPLSVWASAEPESAGAAEAARRALGAVALSLLAVTGSARVRALCLSRAASPNMTLSLAGLAALNRSESAEREAAFAAFAERWRGEPLVMDKWFALQAAAPFGDIGARLHSLLTHPDFSLNPNRLRAVLGSFAFENLRGFHAADGSGYRLLAEWVRKLDEHNPQIASRLADALISWSALDAASAARLQAVVRTLAAQVRSADLREKLGRAVASLEP